jgi:hypothetical protein
VVGAIGIYGGRGKYKAAKLGFSILKDLPYFKVIAN